MGKKGRAFAVPRWKLWRKPQGDVLPSHTRGLLEPAGLRLIQRRYTRPKAAFIQCDWAGWDYIKLGCSRRDWRGFRLGIPAGVREPGGQCGVWAGWGALASAVTGAVAGALAVQRRRGAVGLDHS